MRGHRGGGDSVTQHGGNFKNHNRVVTAPIRFYRLGSCEKLAKQLPFNFSIMFSGLRLLLTSFISY